MRSRPAVFVDGGAPLFRPPSTATSCSEACCGRHAAGAISRLVLVSVSTHAPPPKDKDPARELVLVNAESQASRANYRRRRRRCRHHRHRRRHRRCRQRSAPRCPLHAAAARARTLLRPAPPPKDKDPARELVLVNAESQASRANYRRRRRRCRHSSVLPHSHTLGNRGHAAEQRPRYHQRRQPRSRSTDGLSRDSRATRHVCVLSPSSALLLAEKLVYSHLLTPETPGPLGEQASCSNCSAAPDCPARSNSKILPPHLSECCSGSADSSTEDHDS